MVISFSSKKRCFKVPLFNWRKYFLTATIILFGFTKAVCAEEKASSRDCASIEDLLKVSRLHIGELEACDSVGKAFLIGLGKSTSGHNTLDLESNRFEYYLYTRLYMGFALGEGDDSPQDILGFLQAALAKVYLADSSRQKIYTSFALWRFMETNSNSVALTKGILYDSVAEPFRDGTLEDLLDLACFVLADIPSLDFENIRESRAYSDCKKEGLEPWLK